MMRQSIIFGLGALVVAISLGQAAYSRLPHAIGSSALEEQADLTKLSANVGRPTDVALGAEQPTPLIRSPVRPGQRPAYLARNSVVLPSQRPAYLARNSTVLPSQRPAYLARNSTVLPSQRPAYLAANATATYGTAEGQQPRASEA